MRVYAAAVSMAGKVLLDGRQSRGRSGVGGFTPTNEHADRAKSTETAGRIISMKVPRTATGSHAAQSSVIGERASLGQAGMEVAPP